MNLHEERMNATNKITNENRDTLNSRRSKLVLRTTGEINQRREESRAFIDELIDDLPIVAWQCDFSEIKKKIDTNVENDVRYYLHQNRVKIYTDVKISGGNKTAILSHHFSEKNPFPLPIEKFVPRTFNGFLFDAINSFVDGKSSYEVLTPQPIQFNGTKANWFKFILHPEHKDSWSKVMLVFGDSDFSKQMKEKIKLLNTVLMYSANAIVITDIDARILWVNPSFCEMTGYSEKDVVGVNISILKSGKNDKSLYKNLWNTIHAGKIWHGELINKRMDGTLYSEEMTISPIRNDEGVLTHFISIKEDITLRNEAAHTIQKQEEHYRSLYENAVFGIYRSTPEGEILLANPAMVKMLGYDSLDEFVKLASDSVYDNPLNRIKFIEKISTKGEINNFESVWRKKDGSKIFVIENAKAIKDFEGNVKYFEGTAEDVTLRKEAELTLIAAKENAELSNKLKSEFLAQISHEIRTPVNAILSFASLIKDDLRGLMNDDLMTSFNVINRAGTRLIRTIDLILNMSEIHTGTYEYSPKKLDLYNDILKNVYDSFKTYAKEKNLKFTLSTEAQSSLVYADEYTVNQIFNNLVDNAIKYTSKGSVEIKMHTNTSKKLLIDVMDTGIGISRAYLQNIFTPFSQEEQGYTRKFEGNGLGLALVKSYCDLNKAKINVHSEKGIGSKFSVIFNTNEGSK
ncbi:MAG: PAS domain-containing sensor histidine kinase [bacterium]